MADGLPLQTARLVLRPWTEADRGPFATMSADAETMRFLRLLPTRELADGWVDAQLAHQAEHGFCFWAVAEAASGTFVGAVGLRRIDYPAHFTPAIELGWRIARPFWGRGYAPEAARAATAWGFATHDWPEIVANACVENWNSRRVMAKLGMHHDPADDYDYPLLPEGDPRRRLVLYRAARPIEA